MAEEKNLGTAQTVGDGEMETVAGGIFLMDNPAGREPHPPISNPAEAGREGKLPPIRDENPVTEPWYVGDGEKENVVGNVR